MPDPEALNVNPSEYHSLVPGYDKEEVMASINQQYVLDNRAFGFLA